MKTPRVLESTHHRAGYLILLLIALLLISLTAPVKAQSLSPSSISFSGPPGGPFSPDSQTVRVNDCLAAFIEDVSFPSWLDVSPFGGECYPEDFFDFEFSVTNAANELPPGTYNFDVPISGSALNESPFDLLLPVTLTVEVVNNPPTCTIIDPADNVTITAGQSVEFSGSIFDPNDDPVSFSWSFPGGTPGSSTQSSPGAVSYNTPGVFTATLTGTDSFDAQCTDIRTITVLAAAPAVSIAATRDAAEPDVDGEFTVSLAQAVSGPATINYSVGGTATPGTDYQTLPGSLTIPAGQTSATIPVVVIDDDLTENGETVVLTLTGGSYIADGPVTLPIGSPASATVTIADDDEEPLLPPVCTISLPPGPVTLFEGQTVDFAGSVTSPQGEPTSLQWDFEGGEPGSSNAAAVTVRYPTAGSFTARLSGSDSSGQVCETATRSVLVEAYPDPICTISAPSGDVTIQQGQSVSFTGSVTDPAGGPVSLQWSFPGGSPASSSDGTVSVSYVDIGSFTATLEGINVREQRCEVQRQVTVTELANTPPICAIVSPSGNQTITVGDSLSFTGDVVDPDGDLVSIQWNINPASGVDTSQANPNSATLGQLTFTAAGTYSIDLDAIDERGAPCDFDRLTVLVEEGPSLELTVSILLPAADITIATGETVTFLAEASSTPPGAELTLGWSFGQGAVPSSASGPGPHTVTYTNPGDAAFTTAATVTASAPGGQPVTASRGVTVLPPELVLPDPRIVLPDDSVQTDESVQFNVEIDVPDPNALLYNWTFQDGEPSTSTVINPVVVFTSSGMKQVTLTVTDPVTGQSKSVALTVEVEEAPDRTTEEIVELLSAFSNGSPAQQSLIQTIATVCPSGSAAGTQLQTDCDALIEAAAAGDSSVSKALAVINPDQTSAPRDAALTSVETQMVNIFSRLTALRLGTVSGLELGGLHLDLDGTRISGQQMQSLLEAMGGGASADDSGFSRLGVFVSGRISRGERDATENVEGFDYRIYGLTLGADYRLRDDLILGAALGYSRNDTDVDGGRGDLESDGYSAIFYGTWYRDESFFLDGSFTYGRGDYDQGRILDFTLPTQAPISQTFNADFDGDYFGVALNLGYEIRREALTLIPTARLQYIRTDIDGYREQRTDPNAPGAGWAVEIDDQRFTSFTSSLGVQATYALSQSWGVMLPFAGIEWIHEFEGTDDPVTGRFLDDQSGTTFSLPVDTKDSNYFNLGLGVSAQFTRGSSGFVNYQQVLGYDNLDHYSINAGVRFEF